MVAEKWRGPGKCMVEGKSFRLADEVRYIQQRAAEHDERVVSFALGAARRPLRSRTGRTAQERPSCDAIVPLSAA